MTTEPNDSYGRIVAELRSLDHDALGGFSAAYLREMCRTLADRLEKLSAASVQVTDEDVDRAIAAYEANGTELYFGDSPTRMRAALESLRLSPQGEDHGR